MALGGCSQTLALHVQMELSLLKATVANYETTAKDTNSGGSSSFPSSHQFLHPFLLPRSSVKRAPKPPRHEDPL